MNRTNKRVLLILPPLFWPKIPPLSIGYLQSYLIKYGIKADILDLNHTYYNLSTPKLKKSWLVSCNAFLEENILSIIKRVWPEEYNLHIDKILNYEIVGFSCFKSNFSSCLQIIKELKLRKNKLRIILGGPEITRQFFKTAGGFSEEIKELADFIVVGEGEKSLLNYIAKGPDIDGISRFCELENLNNLPFPVYEGLDMDSYPRKNAIALLFSRGCVKKCRFCSERLLYKRFRIRPVKDIIKEIEYHRSINKTEYFIFHDSMINASLRELEELCDSIIEHFGSIKWEAQAYIRNDMTQELFEKVKRSGCYHLFVGLESGCDKTLKNMAKGFTAKQAIDFLKKLNNARLSFGVSFIVGYPGETYSDFKQSLDFLIQNRAFIPKIEQVNPFTYYDGTDVEKSADYTLNRDALKRFKIFTTEIKRLGFGYTNSFLGNLIEKNDRI